MENEKYKTTVDTLALEKEAEELKDEIFDKYIKGKTLQELQMLLVDVLLDVHKEMVYLNLAEMIGLIENDEEDEDEDEDN